MTAKTGDIVRFLNDVGGGKVTRIVDGTAYVMDEDGFETPMPVRECVVVGPSHVFGTGAAPTPKASDTPKPKAEHPSVKKAENDGLTQLPVVETAGGNVLNIVLGFEATQLKALSQSDFDAYIVNDSNYYIFVAIMTRGKDDKEWTLRYDGVVEPNIQEFAFALQQSDLAGFDRLRFEYIAYKRDRSFEGKYPGDVEFKVDSTKFAKLHCFRPNAYFDNPVISFDINVNDRIQADSAMIVEEKIKAQPVQEPKRSHTPVSKSSKPSSSPIVVDLHASELLDSTAGLSPADILNLQIDRFAEVMQANLRFPGTKIVFIHGKGEGVLRQALMKELTHHFKGHDVQDASFREYGFGATQVTISGAQTHEHRQKGQKRR